LSTVSLPRVGREAKLGRRLSVAGWGEPAVIGRESPHPGLLRLALLAKRAALPTRGRETAAGP